MGLEVVKRSHLCRRVPLPDACPHIARRRPDVQNRKTLPVWNVRPEQMAEGRMASPVPVYAYQILQTGLRLIRRQRIEKLRQNQAFTEAMHPVPYPPY